MTLDYDTIEDEVTCPYCGYVHRDSWEFSDSDDNFTCYGCEKNFAFERVVDVTYQSAKNCLINGEEHDFQPAERISTFLICSKCEASELTPERKAAIKEEMRQRRAARNQENK